MLNHSNNVLLTKVRAMYAAGVKGIRYDDLLSCRNISEVLRLLKENSFYSEILNELPESEDLVHRRDIEKFLKYRFLTVLDIIAKYEKLLGGYFSEYVGCYIDSLFILEKLQKVFDLSKSEKRSYNAFSKDFFCVNRKLSKINDAKTLDDFFTILDKTSYRRILKISDLNLNKNEVYIKNFVQKRLYEKLYSKLFEGIKKTRSGCEKVFRIYLELNNFVMIVRYKRFRSGESDFLPEFKDLKLKLESKLKKINIESELFDLLNDSNLHHSIKNISYSYLEQLPEKYLYEKCRKNMLVSFDAHSVLISFIQLLKIKISNIIKIIEGTRCSLPQNKIKELLVC